MTIFLAQGLLTVLLFTIPQSLLSLLLLDEYMSNKSDLLPVEQLLYAKNTRYYKEEGVDEEKANEGAMERFSTYLT